jgi:hypothetical protein
MPDFRFQMSDVIVASVREDDVHEAQRPGTSMLFLHHRSNRRVSELSHHEKSGVRGSRSPVRERKLCGLMLSSRVMRVGLQQLGPEHHPSSPATLQ